MLPVRWLIGAKTYEPEKIRVFLEYMWRRIRTLEKHRQWYAGNGVANRITAHARKTTVLLRALKSELDHGHDTLNTARAVFNELHRYTMAFFQIYFQTISKPPHNHFAGVSIEKQITASPTAV
jgi:hypothetical protein